MDKPHYLQHRERLRERFLKTGFEGFKEYEALELLLTWAIPRRDVKPIAKDLIKRFGSLKGVFDASAEELVEVHGIKERTAAFLRSLKEFIVLYQRSRLRDGTRITSTGDLLDYLGSAMSGLKDEQFRVLFLNSRNEVIADEVIHEGTVSQSAVYPRKVMERALKTQPPRRPVQALPPGHKAHQGARAHSAEPAGHGARPPHHLQGRIFLVLGARDDGSVKNKF
jgi:DNA repair protein RadC